MEKPLLPKIHSIYFKMSNIVDDDFLFRGMKRLKIGRGKKGKR